MLAKRPEHFSTRDSGLCVSKYFLTNYKNVKIAVLKQIIFYFITEMQVHFVLARVYINSREGIIVNTAVTSFKMSQPHTALLWSLADFPVQAEA